MVVIRDVLTTPMSIELDPEIENQVDWFIQRMLQKYSKKVGETVSLICDHALTMSVLNSLPGSSLAWYLNGSPLVMDPSRVLYNKGNIDITDLTPGDTGVYTCLVLWGPEKIRQNITVGFYSLLVTADSPTRYVFESDTMQLPCNSLPLGQLFPTATRQWQFNHTDVLSPKPTLATNYSVDAVTGVTKSMSGVWECRVKDINTSRIWETAWYRIAVEDQPSFIARVYRWMLDHLVVVIILFSILLAICCVCFGYSAYVMKTTEDETDEEFIETRNGWEETLNSFAVNGEVTINDADLPEKKKDKVANEEDSDKSDDEENMLEDVVDGKDEQDYRDDDEQSDKIMKTDKKEDNSKDESEDKREQTNDDVAADDVHGDDKISADDKNDIDNKDESEVNKSASRLERRRKKETKNRTGYISLNVGRNRKKFSEGKKSIKGIRWTRQDSGVDNNNVLKLDYVRDPSKGASLTRKQSVIYPAVNKATAYHWLMRNSPSFRETNTSLRELKNTPRAREDLQPSLHNSTNIIHGIPDTRFFPSPAERRIRTMESYFVPPPLMLKDRSLSHDNYACAYGSSGPETLHSMDRASSLRPIQYGNQLQGWGADRRCLSSSYPSVVYPWRMSEAGPNSPKSWLLQGRERLRNWTAKRSPWDDRRDIRYTVLPQMDEDDSMDL